MSWVTHSEELVESIAIGESSVYEVDAYWVLRQDIQEMINRAEAIKVSGVRAQWVLEDAIEHLYGAKDALFNTAVFSRTPRKRRSGSRRSGSTSTPCPRFWNRWRSGISQRNSDREKGATALRRCSITFRENLAMPSARGESVCATAIPFA